MKISVSFITSLDKEKETIKKITKTNADFIHLDIMDGKFVDAKNYTFSDIIKIIDNSPKKLDVHLMVSNPKQYLSDYASLNAEYITFHYEAVTDPNILIEQIKEYGLKVGISINPDTSVEKIIPFLKDIDQVLVMSVEPGLGGQQFIDQVIIKIQALNLLRENNDYQYIISVDGGINDQNIQQLKDGNVDMVVVGAYICLSDNYQTQIDKLR